MKTLLIFGELALIFKVTAELNRSDSVDYGGGGLFSLKTIHVLVSQVIS